MDKETLKALKGGIEKWEKIEDGTGRDKGGANCDLCQLLPDCDGCPVFEFSGEDQCDNTPWRKWFNHHMDFHKKDVFSLWEEGLAIVGKCRTCKKLAREELEFLKSLLPKEE